MDPTPSSDSARRSLYQRLSASDATDWLQAAHDVARQAAGDAGTQHGAFFDPGELGRQVDQLKLWAANSGALLDASALSHQNRGGREHSLVDPLSPSNRLLKVTIGPEFGFYPCCFPRAAYRDVCHWFSTIEATPLQYLRRLLLLNELFPRCHTRLVGFVSRGGQLHAVTSQLIAQGRPANDGVGEMRHWLLSQGFIFISAWTWFRPGDGVALFDVLEKNVMQCDDGETVPFDVIPIRCEGGFLDLMNAAVKRMA
ncbi:MAG: hypothetical protein JWO94_2643 [Verrucomicrobiaceae bacterium]|nr:hypothetical protein [Verrucomicrobiaceae bacterium]